MNAAHHLRIAFVKQEVYPDLYVHVPAEFDPEKLLMSSMARVGPIGLFSLFGARAYIVKLDPAAECHLFKKICPPVASVVEELSHKTLDQLQGQEFWRPGSPVPPGRHAVSGWDVNWGEYDIVICINIALARANLRRYPRTLFAYMIGENNLFIDYPRFGYDVCLVQRPGTRIRRHMGAVEFPYTFIGPTCLERLMERRLGRRSSRTGIYAEVNMCPERPVQFSPTVLEPFATLGIPIRLHRQRIDENLEQVFDAKYFVKVGGRNIQGNAIAEAISCGTVVLANPREVRHCELLPREACVSNGAELEERIKYLEQNPGAWEALRSEERKLLQTHYVDNPIASLINCLEHKRQLAGYPFALSGYRAVRKMGGETSRLKHKLWEALRSAKRRLTASTARFVVSS